MRLAKFLRQNAEQILLGWDEFAAKVAHEEGKELDQRTLRDHAAQILQTIAQDLERPQSDAQQEAKSKGEGRLLGGTSAAETHADFRISAGFAIDAMITEYRALRANVLRLWFKLGASGQLDDTDDLMRFNEAIDQAIAESVARYTQQTKKSTDMFIGILGHDIRNPLGTIVMSAAVLVKSGQLSEKAAAPIVNSAIRINNIIEQVVDFTRAQADGVMPVTRSPGNLADQLYKVIQETQIRYPARMLDFERVGNFDGSWDEGRMGQLLSNLLGNAFLYGSQTNAVTVKMWATPLEVFFSVHNHGEPIPADDLTRIFEPLQRGSLAHTGGEKREPGGLGLGLYICREIVLSHGGELTLNSPPELGTTFLVRMPRFPAVADPVPDAKRK